MGDCAYEEKSMGGIDGDGSFFECCSVEKQSVQRFLCGKDLSGLEQPFFPGDIGFSVQRGGMHDRSGTGLCDLVRTVCGIAADREKKLDAAAVCRDEGSAVLGRTGSFLGDDLQLLSVVSFHSL